jgi:hypothetical protein
MKPTHSYAYHVSNRTHFTYHIYYLCFKCTLYDVDGWSFDNGHKLGKIKNYQDCLYLAVL